MTKHGHDDRHSHCEHCLHFCGHCDTAYCCDCNLEWGRCHQSHYPWYQGSTYKITGLTTTDPIWTTTTDSVTANCAHVHG